MQLGVSKKSGKPSTIKRGKDKPPSNWPRNVLFLGKRSEIIWSRDVSQTIKKMTVGVEVRCKNVMGNFNGPFRISSHLPLDFKKFLENLRKSIELSYKSFVAFLLDKLLLFRGKKTRSQIKTLDIPTNNCT